MQNVNWKTEGKRPVGRPRLGSEDIIKIDLTEQTLRGWTGFNWLRIGISSGIL
jgi:hypothetical protein